MMALVLSAVGIYGVTSYAARGGRENLRFASQWTHRRNRYSVAFRLPHRERAQQQAVHQREHRGVRSDAQREREYRDESDDWGRTERAEGEPEILHAASSATIVQNIRRINAA